LTQASDGNFYGTTYHGDSGKGAKADGTVFKITPAGVLTTLHTFSGGADGANPVGALTQGSDGSFYGTTSEGGHGDGTVFKITRAGVFSALHAFIGGADGAYPVAGLTQASDGNFYGTTFEGGGSMEDGTVFKITPAGVLSTLYTFTGGADGSGPQAGLTRDSDGAFYGATYHGGASRHGTVFKLTVSSTVPARPPPRRP
jgi:uncharacterized repeat protein (TIGR03803 family)